MSGDEAQAAFGAPAQTRASAVGYWAGGALLAAAVLGAIAWFVIGIVRFGDAVDDLHRVAVPGVADMTLDKGRASIYYEGPGGSDADVPPLQIAIVSAADGRVLAVGEHSGSVSYSLSGHAGQSVAGVGVPRDGRYRVTVTAPQGAPAAAQLAIGPGLGSRLVRAIVGAIVIFVVGGGVGTLLLVRTSMRRR